MHYSHPLILFCLRWARRIFIPIAVGYLFYYVYRASDQFGPLITTLSLPRLLLAWILWVGGQLISPASATILSHHLRLPLGYRDLALIHLTRLPAKYLPGGVWQSVARFSAYSKYQVKKEHSIAILVCEHLLALGVSITVGVMLLYMAHKLDVLGVAAVGVLGCGIASIGLAIFGISKVSRHSTHILRFTVLSVATTTLFWIAAASSFCAYWSATFDFFDADVLTVAACYLLSWAAGFVALFAPQGLGVFEWVAGHILPSNQPFAVTLTVVAGFRLVTLFSDLSVWLAAICAQRVLANRSIASGRHSDPSLSRNNHRSSL